MDRFNKIAGIGLIVGAILQITRMIPIAASKGVRMLENFPPHSLEETLFAAKVAGWKVSHLMVFISVPFFIFGLYGLYHYTKKLIKSKTIVLGIAGFITGLFIYNVGAVIDGLFLPTIVDSVNKTDGLGQKILKELVTQTHHFAVSFGGLSFTYLLISTGIIGMALKKTNEFKTIGIIGFSIGIIALTGYLTGILDLLVTSSFLLTGGLTMLMFIYFLVLGIKLYKIKYNSHA